MQRSPTYRERMLIAARAKKALRTIDNLYAGARTTENTWAAADEAARELGFPPPPSPPPRATATPTSERPSAA